MNFSANTLHDLRAPLHSIQGFVRLLLDGKVRDPEIERQFLTIVEQESQQLSDRIDELINILVTGSAPRPMEDQCISMQAVILSTIRKLVGLAAEKGITVDTDLDDTLPDIAGDAQALDRVVANLLHNAIKFSPPGTKITIGASKQDGKVITQVSDQGVGIPQETLHQLFEESCRGHSSIVPASNRRGLGLHICKQIVAAHGGQIWVESKPGRGSTFSFTIPFAPELAGNRRRGL